MKLKKLTFLLTALAVIFFQGVSFAQSDWQTVSDDEGRFSLQMPWTPEHKVADHEWTAGNQEDTIAYYFNFTDLGAGKLASDRHILEAGVKGGLGSNKANVLLSKKFGTFNGFSSCDFKVGQKNLIMHFRIAVVKHRLYTAGYSAVKSLYSQADANQFLNSIQFVSPELNTGEESAPTAENNTQSPSDNPKPADPGNSGINWKDLSSSEGGFSVRMPGESTYSEKEGNHTWSLSLNNDNVAFIMAYTDMAEGNNSTVTETLDAFANGSMGDSKTAKLLYKNYIKVEGYPAVEFKFSDNGLIFMFRAIRKDRRIYALNYTATPELFDASFAKQYFGTFRLSSTN